MIFCLKEVFIIPEMSLKEAIKSYLEENPETTKPTFLNMIGDMFISVKESLKTGKKEVEKVIKKGNKGGFKGGVVEKPEKKLNAYQAFMKEQMPLLQKRENEKEDGEAKKKPRELMSEISEMWKMKKGDA
jgi:organic radical activating enzyme